ncbi:hypothetical protein [Fusobacterium gastrosuis]|uniref:hypothetical protein n=1 Tax=Fusobacterium gastrosuis TaxID=1755100 RepID=UPI00297584F3|nr:hypothetical protein [Fusobacteriaceae bacterium]MDY5713850.1 hypothetical protein [Fusobacterium gastrosuis]
MVYYSRFREIFDGCYLCKTSKELESFVLDHKWFFDRFPIKIQEQLRNLYKKMKEQEEFDCK